MARRRTVLAYELLVGVSIDDTSSVYVCLYVARYVMQYTMEMHVMLNTLARFLHLRSLARAARNPRTNWPFLVLTALGWLINRSRRR